MKNGDGNTLKVTETFDTFLHQEKSHNTEHGQQKHSQCHTDKVNKQHTLEHLHISLEHVTFSASCLEHVSAMKGVSTNALLLHYWKTCDCYGAII